MATDELTAEQVEELLQRNEDDDVTLLKRFAKSHELLRADRDRLHRILTTARGPKAGRRTAEKRSMVTQLMDLERELTTTRADRDRLREERDEARKEADDYHRMYDESSADLAILISSQSAERSHANKVRDELLADIAAKDAEIQRLTNLRCCGGVGEPDTVRKVCELPLGHEGYHRQGRVSWMGYYPAAPADEGKTCAPMEDWRGANEEGRKR